MFTKSNIVWLGIYLILSSILSGTHALAQETNAMIGCDAITTSADSITVPVFIDTGTEQFETARMELLFDAAVLSNPQLTVGSDFNLDFGQEIGADSLKAVFSRNALLGATGGRAKLATLTFDWTGATTTLNFVDGDDTAESGSLSFLVGTDSSLTNEGCTIGVGVAITPTPANISTSIPPTAIPESTSSAPLNTTTRSVQSTVFIPVLMRLIVMTAVIFAIGTALFMKQKGRLFALFFVAALAIWSYPTTSASGTNANLATDLCFELQGERTFEMVEPISYELINSNGTVMESDNTILELGWYDDITGCFTIPTISTGIYDIVINPNPDTPDHLNRRATFVVQLDEYINLNTVLLEGDVNGDNQIDNDDLAVFMPAFEMSTPLCEGVAGYDERADLNEDGCVTILDASLLASNLNPDTPLTGDVAE